MSFFAKFFGKGKTPAGGEGDEDGPFMEYPSDEYGSSLEAMAAAFGRLKKGAYGDRWITFCAQGRGHDEDSDQMEEVRVRGEMLDLRGEKVDVAAVMKFGKLEGKVKVEVDSEGMVTLRGATAEGVTGEQMAVFLDAVFRGHFGIRPHEDEKDYAVGAEW